MSFSGTLVSSGTASTNPAPNTLTTSNPYPTTYVDTTTMATAWTTQAKKALIPLALSDGQGQLPIPVLFVPSAGSGAVYTVNLWLYSRLAGTWVQPKDNPSFTLTGAAYTYIDRPGDEPLFLQLSSISSGTVTVYYDKAIARAL
jgi:hypothetical protein